MDGGEETREKSEHVHVVKTCSARGDGCFSNLRNVGQYNQSIQLQTGAAELTIPPLHLVQCWPYSPARCSQLWQAAIPAFPSVAHLQPKLTGGSTCNRPDWQVNGDMQRRLKRLMPEEDMVAGQDS